MFSTNQIKCWFLVRGENRSTRGKTSHSRVENQQTQSTFDAECGNRTRATLVEGKCSHHNANPATFTNIHTMLQACNLRASPRRMILGSVYSQKSTPRGKANTMDPSSRTSREQRIASQSGKKYLIARACCIIYPEVYSLIFLP